MDITIGFSGPAGTGVNTAGLFLAELLAKKGYTLRADKEYASIIKGDNNCFFVSLSDHKEVGLSQKIDLFFVFDPFSVEKNKELYQLENIIDLTSVPAKHKNTFAFGACLRIVNIPLSEGEEILRNNLKEKGLEENLADLHSGYTLGQEHYASLHSLVNLSETKGTPKKLMMGNQLIGEGAIKAGLQFYSAYPMTPVTSLIDTIVEHPEVTFFQGEDEIAVAMTMLGAKYAGKRAMCATSGGGFALMTESIAFAHQAEIGGVYILGMRDGPSTGTPTYTSQGDLSFAIHSSFGETSPIVIAPSTFEEAYSMMSQVFNWADRYQHPVLFLVDKQLCEGYKSVNEEDLMTLPIDRGEVVGSGEGDTYLRYKLTESGISPCAIPGQETTLFMATSYEHDEAGASNEHPNTKAQQMQKRFKKMQTFSAKEFLHEGLAYEIINPQAEKFFITRGINRYTLSSLIKDKPEWGLIVIKVFHPFDDKLAAFFKAHQEQIKKLTFVEMNYEGQMERIVRNAC